MICWRTAHSVTESLFFSLFFFSASVSAVFSFYSSFIWLDLRLPVAFWVTGASVIKDAECVKRKKNESLTILHALHRTSGEKEEKRKEAKVQLVKP